MEAYFEPSSSGFCPHDAFIGGDEEGEFALHVARAWHRGSLVPGKYDARYRKAYVSWGGEEHRCEEYEVLTGSQTYAWVAAKDGDVPEGAVKAGHENGGAPLYVARAWVTRHSVCTIGKLNPEDNCCHVPWAGRELQVRQYEVLCYDREYRLQAQSRLLEGPIIQNGDRIKPPPCQMTTFIIETTVPDADLEEQETVHMDHMEPSGSVSKRKRPRLEKDRSSLIQCPYCVRSLGRKQTFLKHMASFHPGEPVQENGALQGRSASAGKTGYDVLSSMRFDLNADGALNDVPQAMSWTSTEDTDIKHKGKGNGKGKKNSTTATHAFDCHGTESHQDQPYVSAGSTKLVVTSQHQEGKSEDDMKMDDGDLVLPDGFSCEDLLFDDNMWNE